MGKSSIPRSNPGGGVERVGDIKVTTRTSLGDKWVLCNGDPKDGGEVVVPNILDESSWTNVNGIPVATAYYGLTITKDNIVYTKDGIWYILASRQADLGVDLLKYDQTSGEISTIRYFDEDCGDNSLILKYDRIVHKLCLLFRNIDEVSYHYTIYDCGSNTFEDYLDLSINPFDDSRFNEGTEDIPSVPGFENFGSFNEDFQFIFFNNQLFFYVAEAGESHMYDEDGDIINSMLESFRRIYTIDDPYNVDYDTTIRYSNIIINEEVAFKYGGDFVINNELYIVLYNTYEIANFIILKYDGNKFVNIAQEEMFYIANGDSIGDVYDIDYDMVYTVTDGTHIIICAFDLDRFMPIIYTIKIDDISIEHNNAFGLLGENHCVPLDLFYLNNCFYMIYSDGSSFNITEYQLSALINGVCEDYINISKSSILYDMLRHRISKDEDARHSQSIHTLYSNGSNNYYFFDGRDLIERLPLITVDEEAYCFMKIKE